MSTNQSLVISQQDLDFFAPSWQAGVSSLKKSLKSYDIESVNIAKTCEKLSLILNGNSNSDDMFQHANDEKQCSLTKSKIPFRDFSNIWFGTLKIYQQQVNTLFHLSRDLFSRSCNYNIHQVKVSKRKSRLTFDKLAKKRRFTLSGSNEETYITRNFSELLDDLERLTQETSQKSLAECSQSNVGAITQFQVREITIREINATTYISQDVFDEDSGFGEATHEEIAAFFNFAEDNTILTSKKPPTKRKSNCPHESPIRKRCYINDSPFDPLCNENISLFENVSKSPSLKRSVTPTLITNTPADNIIDENQKFLQNKFFDGNDFKETHEIKKENLSAIDNEQFSNIIGAKKKRNKLIIDECTKIDISEIREEMKTFKLVTKASRKRILKAYKIKRNTTALDLLTSFNRKSLKLTLSLKRKFYLSREQFERDYLNLLRDIFKTNFNEKWASEIYPKWRCFKDTPQKHDKKQSVNKSKQKRFINQLESNIHNLNDALNTNIMEGDYFNEYQNMATTGNCNEIESVRLTIYNDWHPYGVMKKLFNLWECNQTNHVAARTLFKLAEKQIDRALGFNSLLRKYSADVATTTTTNNSSSYLNKIQNIMRFTSH